MHISWSFLDKRKATIGAIQAFNSMEFIINNTPDEIQNVRSQMGGATTPKLDGLPSTHDPRNRENSLLKAIDQINVLEERYRQAVEYMDWFKPAWEQLSEEDQLMLEILYMDATENAVDEAMDSFKIERSSVYNKRNRSLNILTNLLYGK